jgi:calcineurin-like phosphoesterase family protein
MMNGCTWLYSDPHFYHANICKFMNFDGSPLRPWDDAEQMTEDMISWYNEMVDDGDRVYILGDVAFTATHMRNSVGRLKGRKVLVKGNHDPDKHREMYNELFDDVRAYVIKKGFIMSHIPIHPGSLSRWQLNIHGHTHANSVLIDAPEMWNGRSEMPKKSDERYRCVCVEQTDFRPIRLDDVLIEAGLRP